MNQVESKESHSLDVDVNTITILLSNYARTKKFEDIFIQRHCA